MKWLLNKESKIPLYLQLRDLIKYYVSTGELRQNQQLPTVNGLGKELQVNFETVRKAYKELEREGLLSTRRGTGTFVVGNASAVQRQAPGPEFRAVLTQQARQALRDLLRAGASLSELESLINEIQEEARSEHRKRFLIFAECNLLQAKEISTAIEEHLQVAVKPFLIKDLQKSFREVAKNNALLAVVTTGFHVNEVRQIVGDSPIRTEFVITNMSPETRRQIETLPRSSRFGFICRDTSSINVYKDILRTELAIETPMPYCALADKSKAAALIKQVDVLLVTPGAYRTVRKMAPPGVKVFNIQDRVDPMSLRAIKQTLVGAA